jgi:2-C-methyl-D-erythritol 2,4-cyclodiphosphate synthase
MRIGFGSDVHRLAPGRPLIIGGVRVHSHLGPEGHSDADVLLHAITDAILGALAEGDIGSHFPSSDPEWKDADSSVFLARVFSLAVSKGYRIGNIDSTVHLEQPKLRPHIDAIKASIGGKLEVAIDRVSVKAKTGEGVDAVGTGAAIRADAVVLLESI